MGLHVSENDLLNRLYIRAAPEIEAQTLYVYKLYKSTNLEWEIDFIFFCGSKISNLSIRSASQPVEIKHIHNISKLIYIYEHY